MLRKLFFLLFFSISLFGADLPWLHNFNKALELAKEQKKDIYVFVGADVCRWCDRFKDGTLAKQEVLDRLKRDFILVYLSRDRHYIPPYFEKQGVPRHYFLRSDGSIIHEDKGGREVDGFFAMLDEVDLKK